jgi:lysylphosphatidylglycerol synthetase-like protein (DUF2156 family)
MNQNPEKKETVSEGKKTYSIWDFIFGIILALVSIFIIISSVMMPGYGAAVYARPGIVPLITGAALLGLSILLVVKSLQENTFASILKTITSVISLKEVRRFIIISLATLLYIALLDMTEIHFAILTAIFLWCLFVYFKVKIVTSTILALVLTGAIHAFFTYAFTIPMP